MLVSLSPFIFEALATPNGHYFTGINRWSTDYYLYLAYVEQGVRGFLRTKLLFTSVPHPSVFFFLSYTIPGLIFGHWLGINSVIIYHSFRAFYGLIFLFMTVFFFYKISKSRVLTVAAFLLTFYVSGFVKIISFVPFQATRYLDWLQEQNIIGRATGPLHYSVGFIVFITTVLFYFYTKDKPIKKSVILGLLLNGLLLANPFNYLLIGACFTLYMVIQFIFISRGQDFFQEGLIIFFGFVLSLPLFLVLNYYLSMPPWGVVGVSPKFYVNTTPPVSLWEAALSVGPIFFLGILGAIISFFKKEKNKNLSLIIFLAVWPVIQFVLLIYGDFFKIHPPRAFSGLYFLPLAYFSAYLLVNLINDFKKIMAVVILLFLLTLPNYYLSYKEQLFAFTDFVSFSSFVYPSSQQVKAFKFLEKKTPPYSGVLALFEASSLINGFSGDMTEVNMSQDKKIPFYTGQLTEKQAKDFLKINHFQYVYLGYQERSVGGNVDEYSFLKKIYSNPEVDIYQAL